MDHATDYRKELTDSEHKNDLLRLVACTIARNIIEIAEAESDAAEGCCDSETHSPKMQHKRLVYAMISAVVQMHLAETYAKSTDVPKIIKMLGTNEIGMMTERITQTLLEQLDEEVRAEAPKF